mmetsp:Transcript_10398/g.32133  ORF Transcript_10398/g.32133 Transcript_10398/m.32133 type:complete len:113 (+) Transcript_10398:30-368(+)
MGKCLRNCDGRKSFCAWEDWSAFGPCSVTCGCGRKKRTRNLIAVDQPPQDDGLAVSMGYEERRLKVVGIHSRRIQTMVVAFLSGCCSLVFVFFAFSRLGRARHTRAQPLLPE